VDRLRRAPTRMSTDRFGSKPELVSRFCNAGHLFVHMFTVLYATAVLHLPRVFGLPYGEMLGLASLGLVLYGVAALPAGWLGDRWSQVGMMVLFFGGMGTGAVVTGLAESRADLLVGLSLIGLFASIYHPIGLAWLVASARKQGMALGINGVFGNAGSAAAPVFVGLMIDFLSWRAAFIVPGMASILVGLYLAIAWRESWVVDIGSDRAPPAPPEPGALRRVFVLLTLTMSCNGFVYAGLTNSMPKLFELGLGPDLVTSYTEIGLFVGLIIGLSSLNSVLGGWLADRYSARSIYLVSWTLMAPVLLATTSLLGVDLLVIAWLALALNITFSAAENMLVARYTPFEWRSLAYGAKFVIALGIGGPTVHLAGELFDRSGNFDLLYLLFGMSAAMAAVCAALLPRARPSVATAGAV
jgi:MFS transporter, FSR family, fosmidomycin resistance protein